jgi:hypothetical protein
MKASRLKLSLPIFCYETDFPQETIVSLKATKSSLLLFQFHDSLFWDGTSLHLQAAMDSQKKLSPLPHLEEDSEQTSIHPGAELICPELAVDRTVVHSAPCSRETAQEKR